MIGGWTGVKGSVSRSTIGLGPWELRDLAFATVDEVMGNSAFGAVYVGSSASVVPRPV